MNKVTIIEQGKNVSCLPGFENLDTEAISKRMPKKRHLKSIKELQWEKERRNSNLSLLKQA
jgi:hypothetical protein